MSNFPQAVLPTCLCVSVRFPSQQTVYVVSGQNLVLRAEFEVPQGDQVTRVTWEQEVEGKRNAGKIITTVAEYPPRNSGGRVTVDKGGSVITLRNFQRTDNGVYTVTVRDQKGGQSSARCSVHEYGMNHLYKISSVLNASRIDLKLILNQSLKPHLMSFSTLRVFYGGKKSMTGIFVLYQSSFPV